MKLFQDHEGERVMMQCGDKDLKVDGYVMGIMENCVLLSGSPDGKGSRKFVPWPNPNVVSIEFFPTRDSSGGTDYR